MDFFIDEPLNENPKWMFKFTYIWAVLSNTREHSNGIQADSYIIIIRSKKETKAFFQEIWNLDRSSFVFFWGPLEPTKGPTQVTEKTSARVIWLYNNYFIGIQTYLFTDVYMYAV